MSVTVLASKRGERLDETCIHASDEDNHLARAAGDLSFFLCGDKASKEVTKWKKE